MQFEAKFMCPASATNSKMTITSREGQMEWIERLNRSRKDDEKRKAAANQKEQESQEEDEEMETWFLWGGQSCMEAQQLKIENRAVMSRALSWTLVRCVSTDSLRIACQPPG